MIDRLLTRLRFGLAFRREPRRVFLICLTVALGTMALILADGFIDRTFYVFREDIIHAHFGHVQVLPAKEEGTIGGGDGGAAIRGIVARELRRYPGSVVAARLTFAGLVAHGDRTVGFLGEGVEPANEAALSRALVVTAGSPLAADGDRQVLLGEGLARSIGAKVGDRVTLLANVPGGGINGLELVVAGLFHTATKAYDDRALRVTLPAARKLTRAQGVSRLMVLLPRTSLAEPVAARLRTALAGRGVVVKPWTQLAEFYNKTVDLFRRQLDFVRTVIVAIVVLATFNSMARNVLERQREIGTMMALGDRRAAVARKFVAEAMAIAVVGGLAGTLAGGAIAYAVTAVGIPMPPPPGNAHGFVGGISFSAANAARAFALVVAACLAASVLPALRASRLSVVDALRAER